MLVLKIYDCKLKKNKYKWRANQNTTKILWNTSQFTSLNTKNILYICNNLHIFFHDVKNQTNTKVKFYYNINNNKK